MVDRNISVGTGDRSSLSSLRRKRGSIQAAITVLEKKLDHWNDDVRNREIDFLQTSLESVQKRFEKFEEIQDKLEEIDDNETPQREIIQEIYDRAVARSRKYIREEMEKTKTIQLVQSDRVSNPNNGLTTHRPIPVKLPDIELPKFDGSVEKWASFYDVFSALIDENIELSPVNKLHYLRSSLKDKAANVIQSLEMTGQNYEVALNLLKNKYDNPRRTLQRHWVTLREFPRLQRDTPAALSQLVDTFQQHLQALENLEAPVDCWDVPIIDLILTKINSNTAWQWELTLTDNKMPSYTNLLSFLEKRANSIDLTTASEINVKSRANTSRLDAPRFVKNRLNSAQTFVTSGTSSSPAKNISKDKFTRPCIICSDCHPVYRCETFKRWPVDERRKKAADASLCFNCLGSNHTRVHCRSTSVCSKCKCNHHSLLHPNLNSSIHLTEAGQLEKETNNYASPNNQSS